LRRGRHSSQAAEIKPGKPIGVSEMGWMSLKAMGGEEAGAEFLRQVAGRLTRDQGFDQHTLAWIWLNDLSEDDKTGLFGWGGSRKQAPQARGELSAAAESCYSASNFPGKSAQRELPPCRRQTAPPHNRSIP